VDGAESRVRQGNGVGQMVTVVDGGGPGYHGLRMNGEEWKERCSRAMTYLDACGDDGGEKSLVRRRNLPVGLVLGRHGCLIAVWVVRGRVVWGVVWWTKVEGAWMSVVCLDVEVVEEAT
jgi:hypothetical protein